jgi:hypothetical protein
VAVFFQKISDDQFNAESDFLVRESKNMKVITGISLSLFSLAAFSVNAFAGLIVLLSAIAVFAKTRVDRTIMKINKQGFYYYGELITDWDHFISEEFIDELPFSSRGSPRTTDQFFLMIKYYKDGYSGYYGRKIQLTDDQDKAEEEIIAAVKFYYNNSRKAIQ